MSRYRQFAPSSFDGEKVELRTKAQRKVLLGKRIGYDLRGSCMSHYGRITGEGSRYEIEIDGSLTNISSLEQVVVLRDQKETP